VTGLPRLRDVSNWQGPVDWRAEKREGTVAVYAKCSQGMSYTDPTFKRRLRNATFAGFWAFGGYHYCVPGSGSGEAQADRLLSLAPLAPGRLRPCLDCEDNSLRLNPQQLAAWYLGAVIRVHSRLGYWPTLYGSPSYLSSFAVYHPEVFGLCPLWLADYGVTHAAPPAPWSHWSAWQWTDTYRDPAVGKVDDSFVAGLKALTIPGVTVVKRLLP
jgi:lysozyme